MDLVIELLLALITTLGGATSAIGTPMQSVETTTTNIVIPQCQEDAILLGQGEFSHGRWTEYVCGPSEDDITVPLVSPPPGAQGE